MEAPQQSSANPCFVSGTARWHVEPGWEDTIPQQAELAELLPAGRTHVVKDGAHRTVYRVDLPQSTVYVKHYRCRGLLRRGRHLFRASSARREWGKVQQLIGKDLPTAPLVAFGEQANSGIVGDSFLITKAIDPSLTLDEALAGGVLSGNSSNAVRLRQETTRQLAQLAAALHQAGVAPDDFHGGNVLLQIAANTNDAEQKSDALQEVVLHLIDVPGVRIGVQVLYWSAARESLIMLASGFMNRTSAAERWRFWKEYLRLSPYGTQLDPKQAARETFDQARAFARKLSRGRDARSLRDNRDFRRIRKKGGIRAHAVRELDEACLQKLIEDPAAVVREFQHNPEKIAAGSLVVRAEFNTAEGVLPVAFKRIRPLKWGDKLLNGLTGSNVRSKALRNWRMGHALLRRGIATARPVFCYSTAKEEYLATEWIAGGENLHLFAWRIAELPEQDRMRLALSAANALGQTLGRMHWWRIRHRDLKGCNLMFSELADGESGEKTGSTGPNPVSKNATPNKMLPNITAHIVDLDGVRILRKLPYSLRVRDLARLAVSVSIHDWINASVTKAFFRAYCKASRPDVLEVEQLQRDVCGESQQLIRRMKSRGATIA